NYTAAQMDSAMEAIRNGISIRQAAKDFQAPYTTLCTHSSAQLINEDVGRPTKFNKTEEHHLVGAALALQKWGEPPTINEFLELAKHYAKAVNKDVLFPSGQSTYEWLRSFLHRNSNLILKKSTPIAKHRAQVSACQVDGWFNLLHKTISENNLANRPGQIFNADETGFADAIGCSKVLVHRGTSNAYRIQGETGGKSFISVMICASATGDILPPYIIYRSKRLCQEWRIGGPPDAGYANTENLDNLLNNSNCIFTSNTSDMANAQDNQQIVNQSITSVVIAGVPIIPLSMTSAEAISILDQVLQETTIDQDEKDNNYHPNSTIFFLQK
ncbi:unnamed protein product, partial [Rotaria sp. Silwood2]